MDKLTTIKIKYNDGTYSDEIPVSVLAGNVEWDSTHTLVDVLGSIDVDVAGTIQDQISQLFNEKVSNSDMQNYISSSMPTYITNWLNTNVNPVGSAVVVDSSLTISGAAADAKAVGNLKGGLSAYLSFNQNGFAEYNFTTKVLTIPGGSFFTVKGHGVSTLKGYSLDVTNYLADGACLIFLAEDGLSLSARPWNSNLPVIGYFCIGYIYGLRVVLFGIPESKVIVKDSNGAILSNNGIQGSFLGLSETDIVTWNRTNMTLDIPQGFYCYRGISKNLAHTVLDLSNIGNYPAWKIWLTSNGRIYATAYGSDGVPQSVMDDCIGYIFRDIVSIAGVPQQNINLLSEHIKRGTIWGQGIIAMRSESEQVVYNYSTKVLTIPGAAFNIYRGLGYGRSAITVDLSNVVGQNDAAILFLSKDHTTIYGKEWKSITYENNNDLPIGYVYGKRVYINGVSDYQISVIDNNSTNDVYCFGDSITAGVGSSKLYHMYFHDWMPQLTLYNYGVGSTGYLVEATTGTVLAGNGNVGIGSVVKATGNNTIIDVMRSVHADMDNIIIFGGTNDFGSSKEITSFRNAVIEVLDYALTKTNNILVITPIKRQNWQSSNSQNLHLADYSQVIKDECSNRGIVCIDGYDVSINPANQNNKKAFAPDGLHPNALGHARMSRCFWNKFLEAICK